MYDLSEAERMFIQQLKQNVADRTDLLRYPYRAKYDNWLIGVRKEYQQTGNRRPRANYDAHTATELRLASPEAMLVLIDDAVARHVAAMTAYNAELADYERDADIRTSFEEAKERVYSTQDELQRRLGDEWELYADACSYDFEESSDEQKASARNKLVKEFLCLVSGFVVITQHGPTDQWYEGELLLERDGLQYKVSFHEYEFAQLVVELKRQLPEAPKHQPRLDAENLKLDEYHDAVQVLTFGYEAKFTEKGRVWS